MIVLLKSQIFRGRKGAARCKDSLHRRIIRQIQIHHDMIQHAAVCKGVPEKFRHLMLDADCGKHNGKTILCAG